MWKNIWPELPDAEIPIIAITNGVHAPTWVSTDMMQLYERYLGLHSEAAPPRPQRLETCRDHSRRGTVADPRASPRTAGCFCPHPVEEPAAPRGVGTVGDRPGRGGARSGRADDRLCPALRYLQTRHPHFPQPRTPGRDPQRQGPAGADHLRRQGSSQATTAARS